MQKYGRRTLAYLDGRDLRELPLIERKRILRRIVPRSDSRLLYVGHIETRGVDLFREVCRQDLEGIVAKWKHGAYVSGDVTSWVKIKNPDYSQAVGRGAISLANTAHQGGRLVHELGVRAQMQPGTVAIASAGRQ